MFWRIILYIYIGVSVLNLIMFTCMVNDGIKILKAKYPDKKTAKSECGGLVSSIIRIIFISLVPLFNIVLLFSVMSEYDNILNRVIKNTEEKIKKWNNFYIAYMIITEELHRD